MINLQINTVSLPEKSQKGFVNTLKERLDVLLVKKGFYQSRERAKASIMAGIVYVDGQKSDKAGNMIDENAEITVKENICPYVSRGGLKLEKAMKAFPLDLHGKICMDIGGRPIDSNADAAWQIPFLPRFLVTLKIWLPDEDLSASGRLFVDASADHYLTIEDAVTVAELLLEKLTC